MTLYPGCRTPATSLNQRNEWNVPELLFRSSGRVLTYTLLHKGQYLLNEILRRLFRKVMARVRNLADLYIVIPLMNACYVFHSRSWLEPYKYCARPFIWISQLHQSQLQHMSQNQSTACLCSAWQQWCFS